MSIWGILLLVEIVVLYGLFFRFVVFKKDR